MGKGIIVGEILTAASILAVIIVGAIMIAVSESKK
jgi:hypothetical protein